MLERFSQVGGTLLFTIVVVAAIAMVLLINRLKQAHPQIWTDMGKPGALKFWGDYKGRWSIFKFVFSEAHAALNDSALSAMVWAMRGLVAVFLLLVAVQVMNGGTHT